MATRSSPWTAAEARRIIKEHAASGLSASAFARRQGFDDARLHRWRRQLANELSGSAEATTPAIIELRSERQRVEAVEIVLASGVTLRVPETFDPAAVARLVAALR